MSFDPKTSKFELSYSVNSACTKPTEIYLNKKWAYASGYSVTISPAGAASWTEFAKNRISVTHAKNLPHDTGITITIVKK
jgi:hypothetical protein